MRATYHRRCEAGIKGGNSELDRESRRAELDMGRKTNSRVTRRHVSQAHASYAACPQNGNGSRVGRVQVVASNTLARSRRRVKPFIQRQNGDQERSNLAKALTGQNVSRRYVASLGEEGLPQKQRPLGKPGDTLTEAR